MTPELLALAGGERLTAQALARRGFSDPQHAAGFLDPRRYPQTSPFVLPGMDAAVARLVRALDRGEPILVWGDFDVDGQTSTALLVDALTELGGAVRYHIPVRAQESHGVGRGVLQRLVEGPLGAPRVLLTCDTGIAAFDALEYAQERGVDVIVTDHHELRRAGDPPQIELPPALAVVTPRRLPENHALSGLPGVGVAYKLAEALYDARGMPDGALRHLDLAALGIVADVAQQTGDTRCLLQLGLEQLRRAERIGLQAVYERAEIPPERITEEQIGFTLGPRFNALGRLADANPAVELLTTADLSRARLLALELEGLNSRRQLLTSQVLQGALAHVEREPGLLADEALILGHPGWHAGVVGIVASRLVELYGKPAALISAPEGEPARGSARSVAGVDITAALAAVDAARPGLLLGFGGHAMAAGFSLDPENLPELRARLAGAVAAQMAEKGVAPAGLQIEAFVEWGALSLELAQSLAQLAPFGAGNPAPKLATRGLRLSHAAAFGRQKDHLQLMLEDENGAARRVIWWGGGAQAENLPQSAFDLAYTVRAADFRGEPELTILFEDIRIDDRAVELVAPKPALELLDWRELPHPLREAQALLNAAGAETQIWAEGAHAAWLREQLGAGAPVRRRDQLRQSRTLIVWSAPPGRAELHAAAAGTNAQRLILVCRDPELDQVDRFLERLTGLVKFALAQRGGQAELAALAGGAAQSELAVRLGLEWLKASGRIDFTVAEPADPPPDDETPVEPLVQLRTGGAPDPAAAEDWLEQLRYVLSETQAYRRYLRRAALDEQGIFI